MTAPAYVDSKVRLAAAAAAVVATSLVLAGLDQTGVSLRHQALAERAAVVVASGCSCPLIQPRTGLVL